MSELSDEVREPLEPVRRRASLAGIHGEAAKQADMRMFIFRLFILAFSSFFSPSSSSSSSAAVVAMLMKFPCDL